MHPFLTQLPLSQDFHHTKIETKRTRATMKNTAISLKFQDNTYWYSRLKVHSSNHANGHSLWRFLTHLFRSAHAFGTRTGDKKNACDYEKHSNQPQIWSEYFLLWCDVSSIHEPCERTLLDSISNTFVLFGTRHRHYEWSQWIHFATKRKQQSASNSVRILFVIVWCNFYPWTLRTRIVGLDF
jgi:hypothetical protein